MAKTKGRHWPNTCKGKLLSTLKKEKKRRNKAAKKARAKNR